MQILLCFSKLYIPTTFTIPERRPLMGTNIHAFVEVNDPRFGIRNVAQIHFNRDNYFFGLLALGEKPEVHPRGLPPGISTPIRFARAKKYEGIIAGESWLTRWELDRVQERYMEQEHERNIELEAVTAMMASFERYSNSVVSATVRLVFWFDV